MPGVVSECFYEPDWDATSPFVPQSHLAFAHEMGYTWWRWLLLLLTAAPAIACAYMAFVDASCAGWPHAACAHAACAKCALPCCAVAVERAKARAHALASDTTVARPVGSTPAGNYVGIYWQCVLRPRPSHSGPRA